MNKFDPLKFFYQMGEYSLLMFRVFRKPEKTKIFINLFFKEIVKLGINSIGIVFIISIFMGAVITLQTAYNMVNPLIPLYLIGLMARDSIILEFSSTMVGLILAGKVGANISSEIGTMRIREQIDAIEIMGVNSANYLIAPKIFASLIIFPLLTMLSMFVGVIGGYMVAVSVDAVPMNDFNFGVHYYFIPFYITYSLVKSVVFGFIITSVSAYQGYYVNGGALEVGRASTKAVVYSSVIILLFNVILTQLMLQ